MPKLVEVAVGAAPASSMNWGGAGTNYVIYTPAGYYYVVYINSDGDIAFRKSRDGVQWDAEVILAAISAWGVSVWYDRWSNISAGLIHVAYTDSADDDTKYRTIDTENSDALSTETVIHAGATTANGSMLSVTRAVGGNVYCRTCIDAGAEGGFYRLPNANVPSGAWDAARTINEALATLDEMILLPDLQSADTQDCVGIFWDASANEISLQKYDDSANTWGETSIAGSMTAVSHSPSGGKFPQFAAAMDLTNSQIVLAAWSNADTLNADLRCWTINTTTPTITEVTNVVTDSTDDQGLAAIGIDTATEDWYVFYSGKTDGSETFPDLVNVYYKISADGGTTWGSETAATSATLDTRWLVCTPRFTSHWLAARTDNDNAGTVRAFGYYGHPRAQMILGV